MWIILWLGFEYNFRREMEIYHANTTVYDKRAYQQMYDALSLRGKEKVDASGNELHRKQRILAYYLLEANGKGRSFSYEAWDAKPGGRTYSISHSGALVYVAIADAPVGIDVEEISRLRPKRVRRLAGSHFFTDGERKKLTGASAEAFLYVWTFKEAMTKLTGTPLPKMLGDLDYFAAKANAEWEKESCFFLYNGRNIQMRQMEENGGIITVCFENENTVAKHQ